MTQMKGLLWGGVVGPVLFIAVFLIEGLTRPGYSAWRHYVSQLATGTGGWVQVVNFLVCGALVIAFIVSNVFATMDMTGRMPNAPTGFLQRIAIIAGWAWISMVSLHFIRVTSLDSHSA